MSERNPLERDTGPFTAHALLATLTARAPEFVSLRHDLHKHPETAFEEFRTAGLVAETLGRLGIETVTGIGGTGVVGILRAGASHRCIGLRADMDALDMDELNTFEHHSVHTGKMHGCGHDGHTATLLAAAAYLAEERNFNGTVYLIFQPAEEGQGGARRMIEDGLFQRFPMQSVFGMHNIPGIAIGSFALRPGPIMAGIDQFEIRIIGKGGHGGMPHLTIDPVVATGAVIQALQSILTRNKDPMLSAVLSITRVHGGASTNVIPDHVDLGGTVRYFDAGVQNMVEQRIAEMASHIAQAHGCQATVRYTKSYPPTVNRKDETDVCTRVLQSLVGRDRVDTDPQPLMAGEDFAFMLNTIPGCYIWAGNGDDADSCSVHNPNYDFNDKFIPFGASYWVRLVETILDS